MKSFMLFSFIEFISCFLFIPNVVTAAVSSTTGVQAAPDLSTLQRNLKRKKRTKTNKKKKSGKASKSSKSNKVPSLCDNQTQEDALLAFKAGINDDPNGIMSNWIPNSPVCNGSTTTWGGVTCVNNQVTKLQLAAQSLNGTVTPLIGCLSSLAVLDLGINSFSGEIPTSLGNLTALTTLRFDENDFSGTIPDTLGSIFSLNWLILSFNALTGVMPSSLGNLTNLNVLDVDFNQLTGTIPSTLGNLLNLRELYVGENNFNGSMPVEICNLKNGGGLLKALWADCDIVCNCCTACYSSFGTLELVVNNTAKDSLIATASFNTSCNYTKSYLC